MKLDTDNQRLKELPTDAHIVRLPKGLVGLPDLKELEIVFKEDQLPFMWLREQSKDGFSFAVIEPASLLDSYSFDVKDEDASQIGIETGEDVLVLNVVTLRDDAEYPVTMNLAAPIVVNRKTRVGMQVILEDFEKHPTHYPVSQIEKQRVSCGN